MLSHLHRLRALVVAGGFPLLVIACSSDPKRAVEAPVTAAKPAPVAPDAWASLQEPQAGLAGAVDAGPEAAAEPAVDEQAIAVAEKRAYERARPVLEKYCATCHASSGKKATKKKLGHFNIDRYPFGGHHADEIGATVREVLGVTGEEPTMPSNKPGVVKGAELEALIEWSHAFDRARAAGLHDDPTGKSGHDHHGKHEHGH